MFIYLVFLLLIITDICRDKTGKLEYEMPFDINKKDVTGQSALYLACYVGNQKLVDILIKYKVQANKYRVSFFLSQDIFFCNFCIF